MVLDYFFGRPVEHLSNKEVIQTPNIDDLFRAQEIARALCDKYREKYGGITCGGTMANLFGRLYFIEDQDELDKFEEAGAHTDPKKCVSVVGNTTRWVMEILLDKGAVEL